MSIEAMKQALEALEAGHSTVYGTSQAARAIKALRKAIEQAEQAQPVAWGVFDVNLHDMFFTEEEAHEMARLKGDGSIVAPLYTAPPPRKPWVGLTGDEVNEFASGCHLGNSVQGAIRKAEAKLKEKNT